MRLHNIEQLKNLEESTDRGEFRVIGKIFAIEKTWKKCPMNLEFTLNNAITCQSQVYYTYALNTNACEHCILLWSVAHKRKLQMIPCEGIFQNCNTFQTKDRVLEINT